MCYELQGYEGLYDDLVGLAVGPSFALNQPIQSRENLQSREFGGRIAGIRVQIDRKHRFPKDFTENMGL